MSVVSADASRVSTRQIYRAGGRLEISPVSKGTWTVTARVGGGKSHRWTGLGANDIQLAVGEAWRWLWGEVA